MESWQRLIPTPQTGQTAGVNLFNASLCSIAIYKQTAKIKSWGNGDGGKKELKDQILKESGSWGLKNETGPPETPDSCSVMTGSDSFYSKNIQFNAHVMGFYNPRGKKGSLSRWCFLLIIPCSCCGSQGKTGGPCGATVACLTPDQEVACSNHVRVSVFWCRCWVCLHGEVYF